MRLKEADSPQQLNGFLRPNCLWIALFNLAAWSGVPPWLGPARTPGQSARLPPPQRNARHAGDAGRNGDMDARALAGSRRVAAALAG